MDEHLVVEGLPAAPARKLPARIGLSGGLGAVLLGAAILWLPTGGCAGKAVNLNSVEEFNQVVLEADGPVLVDFWKFGCASCMMVDPVMERLAEEYEGRVVVAKFMLMNFFFGVTSRELFDRYDIPFFPTVILFVDGREKHRWVWNVDINAYRKVLDELVGPPDTRPDTRPAD